MRDRKDDIDIWCTLGPSSLNDRTIVRLSDSGVAMFRVNLSHTNAEDIADTVATIMKSTSVPICLDTEGPQVRSGLIEDGGVFLKEHSTVTITERESVGTDERFNLRPAEVIKKLRVGDLVSIDFDSVLLCVKKVEKDHVCAKVMCEGRIGSNKAVTIDRAIDLPILSEKDRRGVDVIKDMGLRHISLSFVRNREDVEYVRSVLGPDIRIVSKVETQDVLDNLDDVIAASDAVIIDRGDLSREEPINKIPLLQKEIIKVANGQDTPVLVATNLLESMVKTKKPLRSEVNDIMNTLLDGADGLVLAAETAIGAYPSECVNMVKRVAKYYRIAKAGYSLPELLKNDSFLLVEPHGGSLVNRYNGNCDSDAIDSLPRLDVDKRIVMDAEQIGVGTYSPLTGFMTKDELFSVLEDYKLPGGVTWTLPIVLQVKQEDAKRFGKGDDVALVYEKDGQVYAVMQIKDVFRMDLERASKKWFSTTDRSHPGVKRLFEKGEWFVGGDIELVRRRESEHREYEMTPKQARIIFEHKEWSRVAGFHTRNTIHRVHEYLQLSALDKYDLDGLFIHPVIGPKKANDFKSQIILESYQIMLDHYYPKDKVVLGAFSAYSHYAGPREAVFTALCRKNYGCNYFIVGRDHTGVKNYYDPDESKRMFNQLGDIGIQPIFYDSVHYCKRCDGYVERCDHDDIHHQHISGTQVREMLLSGEQPPDWFQRREISNLILEKIDEGVEVFVK